MKYLINDFYNNKERRIEEISLGFFEGYSVDWVGFGGFLGVVKVGGFNYWVGFVVVVYFKDVWVEVSIDGIFNVGVDINIYFLSYGILLWLNELEGI